MPRDTFRIWPSWPDFMVYENEDGLWVQLDCLSMDEPPQVCVPTAGQWVARMPAWAHGQRERIVARLRGAGCVICEEDDELLSLLPPEGTLRVVRHRVQDERSGLWETWSVTALQSGEVLVSALNYGETGRVRFPRPGVLILALTDRTAQRRHIQIDSASHTFRLLPDGPEEALRLLPVRLGLVEARPTQVQTPLQSGMARLVAAASLLGCLAFVVAGLWVAATGTDSQDRWMGLLCMAFFGACALQPLGELRELKLARPPVRSKVSPGRAGPP